MKQDTNHAWRSGYSLPQEEYVGQAAYEADRRLLGEALWLLIDHESRIPKAGDYFTFDFAGESIIVVRDKRGQIRAHHNVCRHRGSRICLEDAGSHRALTCPYHNWTYELDGRLRGAPLMPEGFDRSEHGLISCHVRVVDGLIFVSMAEGEPPEFDDFIAPFRPYLALHGLGKARVATRRRYPTAANWKLLVENFFECYHCRSAHAAYCKVHDPRKLLAFGAGPGSGDTALAAAYLPVFTAWEEAEKAAGRNLAMFADGPESLHFRSGGRMPIGGDSLTESIDGLPVAPLIGRCREEGAYDGVQTGLVFNPLGTLLVSSDHAVIFRFTPTGPLTSDCEAIWLVHDEAVEGADYEVDRLVALWDITLTEDKTITENNQRGICSTAYRPGPFSTQEQRIADFGRWYVQRRADLR